MGTAERVNKELLGKVLAHKHSWRYEDIINNCYRKSDNAIVYGPDWESNLSWFIFGCIVGGICVYGLFVGL